MRSESIEYGHEETLPSLHTEEFKFGTDERLRQFANVVIDLYLADRSARPDGRKGWVN
jgi:hypothetical protein